MTDGRVDDSGCPSVIGHRSSRPGDDLAMRVGDWHALVSPVLAATVLVVAALLAVRQWAERRGRAGGVGARLWWGVDRGAGGGARAGWGAGGVRGPSPRQDIRRFTGVAIMVLIG